MLQRGRGCAHRNTPGPVAWGWGGSGRLAGCGRAVPGCPRAIGAQQLRLLYLSCLVHLRSVTFDTAEISFQRYRLQPQTTLFSDIRKENVSFQQLDEAHLALPIRQPTAPPAAPSPTHAHYPPIPQPAPRTIRLALCACVLRATRTRLSSAHAH